MAFYKRKGLLETTCFLHFATTYVSIPDGIFVKTVLNILKTRKLTEMSLVKLHTASAQKIAAVQTNKEVKLKTDFTCIWNDRRELVNETNKKTLIPLRHKLFCLSLSRSTSTLNLCVTFNTVIKHARIPPQTHCDAPTRWWRWYTQDARTCATESDRWFLHMTTHKSKSCLFTRHTAVVYSLLNASLLAAVSACTRATTQCVVVRFGWLAVGKFTR